MFLQTWLKMKVFQRNQRLTKDKQKGKKRGNKSYNAKVHQIKDVATV